MSRSFQMCVGQYKECLRIIQDSIHQSHSGMVASRESYQAAMQGVRQMASELNALVGVTSGVALLPQEEGAGASFCVVRGKQKANGNSLTQNSALHPSSAFNPRAAKEEDEKDADHFLADVRINFPSTPGVHMNCPFEVFFDEREWLPCVILEVRSSSSSNNEELEEFPYLWRYTVGIIGYNTILENMVALQFRPFDAASHVPVQMLRRSVELHGGPDGGTPSSSTSSGNAVLGHAVHPVRLRFEPCVVERFTLRQTALVTFEMDKVEEGVSSSVTSVDPSTEGVASSSGKSVSSLVELPISHLHLGKVYPVLRQVQQLTGEERRERKRAAVKRKKAHAEEFRKAKVAHVVEGASSWKSILDDMAMPSFGSGGSAKKSSSSSFIKKFR